MQRSVFIERFSHCSFGRSASHTAIKPSAVELSDKSIVVTLLSHPRKSNELGRSERLFGGVEHPIGGGAGQLLRVWPGTGCVVEPRYGRTDIIRVFDHV